MSHPKMRAKMEVESVQAFHDETSGELQNERLAMHGVSANKYGEDGLDEDNTFAKFSPSVRLDITIANPALFGKFKAGDRFYADFTPAK